MTQTLQLNDDEIEFILNTMQIVQEYLIGEGESADEEFFALYNKLSEGLTV